MKSTTINPIQQGLICHLRVKHNSVFPHARMPLGKKIVFINPKLPRIFSLAQLCPLHNARISLVDNFHWQMPNYTSVRDFEHLLSIIIAPHRTLHQHNSTTSQSNTIMRANTDTPLWSWGLTTWWMRAASRQPDLSLSPSTRQRTWLVPKSLFWRWPDPSLRNYYNSLNW